ncbi:protein kinase domain-containing protein [Leptodesmis sp.]|uniref:protein kinase domain-containing protein n=1 Tax=Leptodesmis sp. TaxID=3100501 RepID=UPI00405354DC
MAPPIPLGTLLRQRYLIQQVLGQGGFGRTYLAIDQERFDERCVLKEFSVPYEDPTLIQKSQLLFQREATTLYQLQHPQIPRFWAAFEEGQRLFLVQDFVEGPTYRSLLKERKQQGAIFSEAEVLHFLMHMLPVLSYIHDRGIIHRDISPDNIILKGQGTAPTPGLLQAEAGLPVLIDFGAVKEAATHWPLNSTTTRVGKVGYAPPEQLQTGRVYPNSDLYALAATSFVLLTGQEPRSLLDSQTLEWKWQPYASISDGLAVILLRMLSVYPGDRYQSAQAVLQDLQPLIDPSQVLTELQPPKLKPIELPANLGQHRSAHAFPSSSHASAHPQANLLPPTPAPSPVKTRSPQTIYRKTGQPSVRRMRIAIFTAFLLGTALAGSFLWRVFTEAPTNNREVWVSGARLPESEASQIVGVSGTNPGNLAIQPSANSIGAGSSATSKAAPPQSIQFPTGKISTVLQGNLQQYNVQPYVLRASQGQILTATLDGSGVVMNLLRSNQEGVDAAAYQTRNWTGSLPADDNYLIQISGTGPYTLQVAVTPTSRPTQEMTERVSFAKGTNGTTVTGKIAPNQIRRYLLKAHQGQIVLVKVLQGQVSLSVIAPNGDRIGGSTTTSKDWKGRLPMEGDYVMEVSTTQPGDYALSFEIF